ncbi:hypothetical protein [Dokdonella koreensis]|nr:hypothetical protein [Dokdonella koreensis]
MKRMPSWGGWGLFVAALGAAMPAQADLVVYDDALRNGFQNWSWGEVDLQVPAPVHAGTQAIAFRAHSWQGLSFARPGQPVSAGAYPQLRFWIRGEAGGEQFRLVLQSAGAAVAEAALDGFVAGGAVAAGQYREVVVRLADPPLAYAGAFDRIDLVDASGRAPANPQRVHVDEVRLVEGSAVVDPVFADGFEGSGPPPAGGLAIEHGVAIDGLSGDRFAWTDRAGLPRSATLAHNNAGTAADGSRGGELREFRYQVGAATRTLRAVGGGAGGFGYVVSHPTDAAACTGEGDSSSLGHFTPGQFQRVFEGRHHAIFRFTQAYPRYCTVSAPAARHDVPVTIDWVFANGRDHPLWSITWDLSAVPVGRLADDSRAPYGELRIDGAASDGARSLIAGTGWGDRYRFTSSTDPLTLASAWTWNQPNTVPYAKLWTTAVDATMGIVQSETIDQQDAGGYWGQDLWMRTSGQVSGCPGNHLMPCNYNWPFQTVNYSLSGGNSTRSARIAWGTNFGFLGQAQYRIRGNAYYGGSANGTALPGDPMAPGWPRKSYATYIVFGTHSADPVGAQVAQIETIQGLSLSATIGSVATSGPAGVADATTQTYAPPGYDAVYGALTFVAAANRLDANIAVASGMLRHPLLVLRQYGGSLPATLRLNGAVLVRDQDWLPSPRPGAQELWITLKRDLSGAVNRIEIVP